jgi:hypothetical protein
MANAACAATVRWLADSGGEPPAELAAHVAGCAHCRGALTATLAAFYAPAAPEPLSCAACSALLPAYLDLEQAQGTPAAARRYPNVWWHLWVCPECAEQAHLVSMLLGAEAVGLIPAPPRARPQAIPPVPTLRFARAFLAELLAPQRELGTAWNGADGRMVIAEDALPGCRVVIAVRQRDATHCDLEIRVEPPVAGSIIVSFGATTFRAPLLAGTQAVVEALPAALLTDRAGPDLTIAIEREHGDQSAA